jgi:predicted O-methyltransferase YrrM
MHNASWGEQMITDTIRTALWYCRRPNYWAHACELIRRKITLSHRDTLSDQNEAYVWAAKRAKPVSEALMAIGLAENSSSIPALPVELFQEGQQRALDAQRMGGPGDLDLLFAVTRLGLPQNVIETGVAYGWSSLAILAGLDGREGCRLVSVDMPYPKMNNERWVGVVVPERLRSNWTIVREPDRRGLEKAIACLGGKIELCHYDSDKSYRGRQYGYRLLWEALVPGGVFISDDIQDNMAFAEFVDLHKLSFAVTESDGKFVGIVRRP